MTELIEMMMLEVLTLGLIKVKKPKKDSQIIAVTSEDKKNYIIKFVPQLSLENKKKVCSIIVQNGYYNKLIWCKEGSIINLDLLPENIISNIYNFVKFKAKNY